VTTAVARNSVLASLALALLTAVLTAVLSTATGRELLTEAGTAIVETVDHLLHPHLTFPWMRLDPTDSECF